MNRFQLSAQQIAGAVRDPKLEVMNFLNEVTLRYPQAISFAPGRPPEASFDVAGSLSYIEDFIASDALAPLAGSKAKYAALGQYGRTNGLICELIAKLLRNDERIDARAADIVVTVGCQEAMCLCLAVLCGNPGDVALVTDPAYIGISGAARMMNVELAGIPSNSQGLDVAALERTVECLRKAGKHPRILYLSPDYANPTGVSMPQPARQALLALTRRLGLIVIEDHAYNYFYYSERRYPLKALPDSQHVIYLGSFSKSIYPGLRLGFMLADQNVAALGSAQESTQGSAQATPLAAEMSKAKSLMTVNTSALLQAIAGGLLLRHECSLTQFTAPRRAAIEANRDTMIGALERRFERQSHSGTQPISWNRPDGGFFLCVNVPFTVTNEILMRSASRYGVTWMPMSYFCLERDMSRQIRLSFSSMTAQTIEQGIERFAAMVQETTASESQRQSFTTHTEVQH